jgi:hypothetical protein
MRHPQRTNINHTRFITYLPEPWEAFLLYPVFLENSIYFGNVPIPSSPICESFFSFYFIGSYRNI